MTDQFSPAENSSPAENNSPDPTSPAARSERARTAAVTVTRAFGRRLFGLPFTHLGTVRRPAGRLAPFREPWHYWWQAHYVDCLVDAGWREHLTGRRFDGPGSPSAGRLASRLVRTIRLRNLFRVVNSYYDDMAWLALATGRLDALAAETERVAGKGRPRPRGRRRNRLVSLTLRAQLESAHTPDLGGGLFWNTDRNFKNAPATAPAALVFARSGETARAQELIDWLNAALLEPERGVYLDGLRMVDGKTVMVRDVYSYNQGPVLGALLELGGPENLAAAGRLVLAIDRELAHDVAGSRVLITHGGGDGGLFTGILVRYLALAAARSELPKPARDTARQLVHSTADAFWAGRGTVAGHLTFAADPARSAAADHPAGTAVELSTQLQAWMVLEASAAIPDSP